MQINDLVFKEIIPEYLECNISPILKVTIIKHKNSDKYQASFSLMDRELLGNGYGNSEKEALDNLIEEELISELTNNQFTIYDSSF